MIRSSSVRKPYSSRVPKGVHSPVIPPGGLEEEWLERTEYQLELYGANVYSHDINAVTGREYYKPTDYLATIQNMEGVTTSIVKAHMHKIAYLVTGYIYNNFPMGRYQDPDSLNPSIVKTLIDNYGKEMELIGRKYDSLEELDREGILKAILTNIVIKYLKVYGFNSGTSPKKMTRNQLLLVLATIVKRDNLISVIVKYRDSSEGAAISQYLGNDQLEKYTTPNLEVMVRHINNRTLSTYIFGGQDQGVTEATTAYSQSYGRPPTDDVKRKNLISAIVRYRDASIDTRLDQVLGDDQLEKYTTPNLEVMVEHINNGTLSTYIFGNR